jgi:hypothetical protein
LLLEHPTLGVPPADTTRLGDDIRRIAERRHIAALTLTADLAFARAVAARVLTFDPANGRLARRREWGLRG